MNASIKPEHVLRPVDARTALHVFWSTRPGALLLQDECSALEPVLARCFGLHGVLIAPSTDDFLLESCSLPHCFVVDAHQREHNADRLLIADPSRLALASESVDLVFLHHSLDFADRPQAWVREAVRVLRPGGSLILVGFNPRGLWGILRWLTPPWKHEGWMRMPLSLPRLNDWLGLLDMRVTEKKTLHYRLPFLGRTQRLVEPVLRWLMERYLPGFGAVYLVMARKQMRLLTPWAPGHMGVQRFSPAWFARHPSCILAADHGKDGQSERVAATRRSEGPC